MAQQAEKVFKIAQIISPSRVVINAGRDDGLRKGQRAIIYSVGDEVFDPDTQESLGRLELVKGEGKIQNVQDRISTLYGFKIEKTKQRPISALAVAWGYTVTEESNEIEWDFDGPTVGDFVKLI